MTTPMQKASFIRSKSNSFIEGTSRLAVKPELPFSITLRLGIIGGQCIRALAIDRQWNTNWRHFRPRSQTTRVHFFEARSAPVKCETKSKGIVFRRRLYHRPAEAMASIIQICSRSSRTDSGECRYSVTCAGVDIAPYARCKTTRAGLTFKDGAGFDLNGMGSLADAGERAITACQAKPNTPDNGVCSDNLVCVGGEEQPPAPTPPTPVDPYPPYNPPHPEPQPEPYPYPQPQPEPQPEPLPPPPAPPAPEPSVTCSTHSNGRSFSIVGRGYERTLNGVIATCQQNPYSDPGAFQQNAYCY